MENLSKPIELPANKKMSKPEKTNTPNRKELKAPRLELMECKKRYLEIVKAGLKETFGQENLPEDLVMEMINIRRGIKKQIQINEYIDDIDVATDERIKLLMAKIYNYKDKEKLATIDDVVEYEDGKIQIILRDQPTQEVGEAEKELLKSLRMYFDSYKLAHNACQFRKNVKEAKNLIIEENKSRKLSFHSEDEKSEAIIGELRKKYSAAGFTDKDLNGLLQFCKLEELNKLEIHDIKILRGVKEVFDRFMKGDTAKYTGLSVALLVPAIINGYAPIELANAVEGDEVKLIHGAMFVILRAASAGMSIAIHKFLKDFMNKNFAKEGGIDKHISKNISELPSDEVSKLGAETIKQRILNARSSYAEVLEVISIEFGPILATLIASLVTLAHKSLVLTGGLAAGAGTMWAIDKYILQKMGFWKKEAKARLEMENITQKMDEQIKAHMEIILAGEKEKFRQTMDELLSSGRVADTERKFLRRLQDTIYNLFANLNGLIGIGVTYLAGGGADKYVAALAYSGMFGSSVTNILSSHKKLLASLRDIKQMDLMFNGFADEEIEKEKDRLGVDQIKGSEINLKNVNVEYNKKQILKDIDLNIPAGSMVSLIGASGAGKSTLMKIISGYYQPSTGEVSFGGVDMDKIKKSGENSIYTRIAYLSQFPYILEDSVRNNLQFGTKNKLDDEQIQEVLREVGLGERFTNLNEKLTGGMGDTGIISGGECSRLGLARVLLQIRNNDSKIVYLDEPTASIDEDVIKDVAKIINKEKANKPDVTFIVISHNKEFIEMLNCDIEVRMKKGEMTQNNLKGEKEK